MTQSLTERLQERLATQSAEIERLTASELARLGESLRRESEAALFSMRNALGESITETTRPLRIDLERLKGIGRWWWSALALTWLMLAGLTGLSLWLWMGPSGTGSGAGGTGPFPTFTYEGDTFMLLPEGSQAWTCTQGEQTAPCVRLPDGGTGGTPAGGPMRPRARPDGV